MSLHPDFRCVNCYGYAHTTCDGCGAPLCYDCNQLLNKQREEPKEDGLCWECRERRAGTYDGEGK